MGCGSSKSVATVSPSSGRETTAKGSTVSLNTNKDAPSKNTRVLCSVDKNKNIINVTPSNSTTNVNNFNTKPREISASSTRTTDSGICEEEVREILTENSNLYKLDEVRVSERPNTPELALEGRACPRLQSGKKKRRLELEKKNSESNIPKLPPLGDGSLMQRPKTRGGMAFDIMLCPETGNIKKAPANLPKLESRKKEKKLTKEELDEKMRKAAERRLEHKKKIVKKSQAFLVHFENAKSRVDDDNNTSLDDSDSSRKATERNENSRVRFENEQVRTTAESLQEDI